MLEYFQSRVCIYSLSCEIRILNVFECERACERHDGPNSFDFQLNCLLLSR